MEEKEGRGSPPRFQSYILPIPQATMGLCVSSIYRELQR